MFPVFYCLTECSNTEFHFQSHQQSETLHHRRLLCNQKLKSAVLIDCVFRVHQYRWIKKSTHLYRASLTAGRSYLIHHRLKITKISPTRPESTAVTLLGIPNIARTYNTESTRLVTEITTGMRRCQTNASGIIVA